MTKRTLFLLPILGVLTVAGFLATPAKQVSAHRDGCHRWHSCPSDSGSYVCGDLGYYSECPGGAPKKPAQTFTPRTPVVTKKNVTTDEAIAFRSIERKNYHEYPGYRKVATAGVNGIKRTVTEVTFTDGKETARNVVITETSTGAIDEIIDIGARIRPEAKITRFWYTKKKDVFDIKGIFKPKTEVVIFVNGKKVKRAKTDGKGVFLFKGIKVKQKESKLIIYERKNRKERQVSEKTFVNRKTKDLATEYQRLHQQ